VKRNVTILLLILLVSVFAASCSSRLEDEQLSMVISEEKFDYAYSLLFRFQLMLNEERTISSGHIVWNVVNPTGRLFDPFFTELVFVPSEANATGFPDNIIVAWPYVGEHNFTEMRIDGLHRAVSKDSDDLLRPNRTIPLRDVITFEEFGLSYPLTVEDLVDNWEKVHALWNSLTRNERSTIGRFGG